jgi:signal transduction histidine kinase
MTLQADRPLVHPDSVNRLFDSAWDHPSARLWMCARRLAETRPQALDALIAAGVLAASLIDLLGNGEDRGVFTERGPRDTTILACAVALALPLFWRRRAPLAVWAAVTAVCAAEWSLGLAQRSDLSAMIALYGVSRYAHPRSLKAVTAGTVPACALLAFRVDPLAQQPFVSLFFVLCAATAALALGLASRLRRAQLAAFAERTARLEIEREHREQLTVANERASFSRELHDILGHSLAVIVGLAEGGAMQATLRPDTGPDVLRMIAETGRASLGELRRTLGVMRVDQPDLDRPGGRLHPQPGTAQIPALCERIRAAGPVVSYTGSDLLTALSPSLQLAIYRIVQEALTNSLKHAGPHTTVAVEVVTDAHEALVQVKDTGPPTAATARPPHRETSGQGLIGIRERAVLAGGNAVAGRRPDGGWTVRAVLPVNHAARTPCHDSRSTSDHRTDR